MRIDTQIWYFDNTPTDTMWSPGTWMWRAVVCCMLLETFLHTARGLNMCMGGSATSCEECLLIHRSCAWCAQEEFGRGRTLTRCDFSQNLQKRGCDARFIEYPTSSVSVLHNMPLSSKGSGWTQNDVVQIQPQKLSLSLRPGDQTWFELQVRQVEDYPVDLYYLMDLSLSMKDDLETIRNLGTKLALEMGKLTSNFRLGFGSFVDKNIGPLQPGGAEADDDVPHLALDGRLGGLVQPHDGECHLNDKNEYSASTQMDYPSLALLGEKLAENNIFLIFAVTKRLYVIYKNFTALIPGTTVEILDTDSKNNIRSKVELSVWDHPEDISLSFTATCQDGKPLPGLRKCADLKIGDTVSFNVSVEARSCPSAAPSRASPSSRWDLKTACRSLWIIRGTYNCGTCHCEPGYLGARCECQEGESGSSYLSACREAEGKQVCSGRGECSCNQCLCYESEFGKIYGTYCECDDFSCARHKGILCSGHGECHCGECKCHAGFIGDNCNCSTETSSCIADDGQMCSGRGSCVCGRCQCSEPGAFGDTCEKCPTCPDACGTKRECIECRLFNSGRLADNQTCQRLCKDEIITMETLDTEDPGAVLCLYKTENDCVMKFTYSEHASGLSILTALKEPECGGGPDAMVVLLAVVGSILLVGVVLLAVWKLAITVHDRREFSRFQSAGSRARFEMASNPLYKQPVTTHFVETDFNMYRKSYNGGEIQAFHRDVTFFLHDSTTVRGAA
ncbi:hypothetical protein F7725_002384 [Dissostichus mawsoni]|uniref:Integrin beta n=1 Tax=Dissostichus mawsoni TaxID=36200 RepID=A0A7J5Y286_DISMA|nr:hypothetical protein F7725_002384 [Dissostichus mawsoni]